MKRKNKEKKKSINKTSEENLQKYEKNIYDILGVDADVISNEVKIIVMGDFLVEIHNHNGVVDMNEKCIKVNTKKNIYSIVGEGLKISLMTDEKLDIRGKIKSIENE